MPRVAKSLTVTEIKNLKNTSKSPKLFAVGEVPGLNIQITPSGAKQWILRYTAGTKPGTDKQWRRDLGLGGFPGVGLADARARARAAHEQLRNGIDPIAHRKETRSTRLAASLAEITFEVAALQFIEVQKSSWKAGGKSAAQWTHSLTEYAFPIVGRLRVCDIEASHVIQVLEPHWATKTETMTRIRQRIEAVLDWAKVRGYRAGENPALWSGNLKHALPKPSKVRTVAHHAALPIPELPAFMTALKRKPGVSARALEFTVLTAARSGEVRGATWSEIDLTEGAWIVPAARMKAKKEHRVPLPKAALDILRALPVGPSDALVFPGPRGGKELSDNTLSAVLKRMDMEVTVHGFRSTFRDWCAEHTEYPAEVAEMALAHQIKNKVEAAYRRGDLFDKRAELMESWATFANGFKG